MNRFFDETKDETLQLNGIHGNELVVSRVYTNTLFLHISSKRTWHDIELSANQVKDLIEYLRNQLESK